MPIEAATARFVALGKSGSGKTNAGVVLAEELVAAGVTVAILDVLGNMHGLRAAGEGDGLPIAILGGLHGDVPVRADRGAVVADLVASGVSAVVDLSTLTREDAQEFAADFFARLVPAVRASGRNVHVIVEEAESFAPQLTTSKAHNAARAAATVFARTARNVGIGWTFSTQRPQLLSKDVIDSSTAFLAMKMTGDLAQAAIGAEATSRVGKKRAAEIVAELPRLARGEAWLVPDQDWLGDGVDAEPEKFRFRWRRTFDSARPPKVGERREEPRMLADVDLAGLREAMASDFPAGEAMASHSATKDVGNEEVRIERVEVPVSIRSEITDLQFTLGAIDVAGIVSAIAAIGAKLDRIISGIAPVATAQDAVHADDRKAPEPTRREHRVASRRGAAASPPVLPGSPSSSAAPVIGGGPTKILRALAAAPQRRTTRTQLAFLAGFSHGGGSYARYLTTLRGADAIADHGGMIALTPAGERLIGDPPARATSTADVLAMFSAKLTGGPLKMFNALVVVWPKGLTRDDLATTTGYEASGGSFARYLTTLSSAQLIERKSGVIRLVDELFPTGRPSR